MELVINDWFRQYYDILYYQQSRPIVRNMLIAEFGKLTSLFPTILIGKGEFHVFSSETSLLTDVNFIGVRISRKVPIFHFQMIPKRLWELHIFHSMS